MEHSQTETLNAECEQLKQELTNAKVFHTKQENLIHTLREVHEYIDLIRH